MALIFSCSNGARSEAMWCQPKSIPWHSKILQLTMAGSCVWRCKEVAGIRKSWGQAGGGCGYGAAQKHWGAWEWGSGCKNRRRKARPYTFAAIRLPSSLPGEPGDNSGLPYVCPEPILQSGRLGLAFSLISWSVTKAQMWFRGQEQCCQPVVRSTPCEYFALPNCLLSHSLKVRTGSEAGQLWISAIRQISLLLKAKCLLYFIPSKEQSHQGGTGPFLHLPASKAKPDWTLKNELSQFWLFLPQFVIPALTLRGPCAPDSAWVTLNINNSACSKTTFWVPWKLMREPLEINLLL